MGTNVGHNGVMTCVSSHDKWRNDIFVVFSFILFFGATSFPCIVNNRSKITSVVVNYI